MDDALQRLCVLMLALRIGFPLCREFALLAGFALGEFVAFADLGLQRGRGLGHLADFIAQAGMRHGDRGVLVRHGAQRLAHIFKRLSDRAHDEVSERRAEKEKCR